MCECLMLHFYIRFKGLKNNLALYFDARSSLKKNPHFNFFQCSVL